MERDFLKSLRAVRTLDIDLRVAMDEVPTGTPFKFTGNCEFLPTVLTRLPVCKQK